jgi:hypothetical protein
MNNAAITGFANFLQNNAVLDTQTPISETIPLGNIQKKMTSDVNTSKLGGLVRNII